MLSSGASELAAAFRTVRNNTLQVATELMLILRMLGVVPHLTRQMQQRLAAAARA